MNNSLISSSVFSSTFCCSIGVFLSTSLAFTVTSDFGMLGGSSPFASFSLPQFADCASPLSAESSLQKTKCYQKVKLIHTQRKYLLFSIWRIVGNITFNNTLVSVVRGNSRYSFRFHSSHFIFLFFIPSIF